MNPLKIFSSDLITRWKRLIRSRNTIVWVIIIPVIIISIIGTILPNDDGLGAVYVQNKDGGLYSTMAVSMLVNDYSAIVIDSEADTKAAIDEICRDNPKQTAVIIIIPDNFSDYVKAYRSGDEFKIQVSEGNMSFVMDTVKAASEDYDDGYAHITLKTNSGGGLLSKVLKTLNNNLVRQVSPGISVSLIMMIVSGITVAIMRIERESRVDVILRNTNYNKGIQIASMTVWALLPSTIVFIMSYITLLFFIDATFDILIVAGLLLTSTMSVAIGLVMSELIKDGQSMAIANASVIFAMLLLSGGIFPKDMLSERMTDIGSYVPVTYLIDIFRDSMGYGGNFGESVLMSLAFIGMLFGLWYILVNIHERRL